MELELFKFSHINHNGIHIYSAMNEMKKVIISVEHQQDGWEILDAIELEQYAGGVYERDLYPEDVYKLLTDDQKELITKKTIRNENKRVTRAN